MGGHGKFNEGGGSEELQFMRKNRGEKGQKWIHPSMGGVWIFSGTTHCFKNPFSLG